MGYEYRLHVEPPLTDLEAACDAVFASSEWRRIPTSFSGRAAGIGVQRGEAPDDASWPQVADLYLEMDQVVFVVAHNQVGGQFLRALIAHLESTGHVVMVDDDV